MSLITQLRQNFRIIVTVLVTVLAILCRQYVYYFNTEEDVKTSVHVLSQDQLKRYNGLHDKKLYLAVIGTVFDVSEKVQHYGKDAPYHYFVGKDGSRALVTGNFTDESEEKDHIIDLSCNELSTILDWRKTFREKYSSVGLLVGRYYDKYGRQTDYMRVLKKKLQQCKIEKARKQKESLEYPPCNISWNEEEGTKVWCTNTSGGVKRSWVGVPRQLFTPGEERPQCVCVQSSHEKFSLLKAYDGCPETSMECLVPET